MSNENLPTIIAQAAVNQQINPTEVNLMMPTQTYGQVLGVFDKLTIEVVTIDPDPKQGDVYEPAYGKYALGKRPLSAIANAVGIIWDPQETRVIESSATKSRAKATGAMRKPNGEWIPLSDEKTIDIEIIEEELIYKAEQDTLKGEPYWDNGRREYRPWKSSEERQLYIDIEVKKALLQKRKFKDELAMTGAKERVIRQLLAIKQTYSKAELSKPFAFPRVTTDTAKILQDPEMRKVAIDRMSGSVSAIFGPGRAQNGDVHDVTPVRDALPELLTEPVTDARPDEPQEESESPPPFEAEEETLKRRLRSYADDADGKYAVLKKAGAIEVIESLLANDKATLKALQDMDKRVEDYLARQKGGAK